MTAALVAQAAGVFGTGILASLSPCVYPMLPITVGFFGNQASSGGKKISILSYVLGQTIALIAIGLLAVELGESLGFSSQSPTVNLAVGVLLFIAGVFSWMGRLPKFMTRMNDVTTKLGPKKATGPFGAFLFGVSAALVASPCTSPILGGVLALMATAGTFSTGLLLMTLYAVGFSLLFLVIGLGVLKAGKLPSAGPWMQRAHKFSAVLLFGAGIYYISLSMTS